ncbi:hypothetical protein K469DRAFT_225930 [Zopfia rhizophila CBS 207.26]|uniref:Uncharacterized protein n=1 Tax=Zopfia rhizophila CBS 207.26 TaxID=1314779 RepID=A0A6A6DU51_9PEZI|nr:hypothetical protein K469DRAFT_225930 [Zopfia rhizophila CBS 207.26]
MLNSSPNGIPRHSKDKMNPPPYKGFCFKEHGKNYTCYETHTLAFEPNYQYSNTHSAYESFVAGNARKIVQDDIYPPQPSRQPSPARQNRNAPSTSLPLKLRGVVQALQNRESEKEVVSAYHGYWPYCFEYLSQIILCNTDDSIEISSVFDGMWVGSGFGSVKECREHRWLYDVAACGEMGCEGKGFWHLEEEMKTAHKEEEEAVEKWAEEHKG